MSERFLNLAEAAALLGAHPDTLRERAKARIIPGAKIGRGWRFIEADLLAYFRSQYREETCQFTNAKAAMSGMSTSAAPATVDCAGLVESEIAKRRSESTTRLQLVSGMKNAGTGPSKTRSRRGSKRGREQSTS